jgi:hypothetical protein
LAAAAGSREFVSNLGPVSSKSERRAARSVVAEYHDVQLGELVTRVGDAVDRYRAGELDAFDVDRVLFQYSRAAKELWKFCNHLRPHPSPWTTCVPSPTGSPTWTTMR